MLKWEDLEMILVSLLKEDGAKRTPGSGNSKTEEDVVGRSIICQCKATSNKNITILDKDIQRLIRAANMLQKFPLFVSQAQDNIMISIPLNNSTSDEIALILKIVMIKSRLRLVKNALELSLGYNDVKNLSKELLNISRMYGRLSKNIREEINILDNIVDAKILDHATYNLFDGDNNAT